MDRKKEYTVIFLIMVTEVLGFSLILPFLPLYAEQLGASPIVIGLLMTVFSLFQFISSPIMGRLSDSYGRRPLLMLSQLSTCIGFIILGLADSLWLIFLSRIVDGLLGSNFTIAQAYLSDISSEKERSKAFGLVGAAFGVGFFIGPAIGGFLSSVSYSLPAYLAAGFSLMTIVLTYFFLPETVGKKDGFKLDADIFQVEQFRRYFSVRDLSLMMLEFSMFILAHVIWVSTQALYAEKQIGFGAREVGYSLAYVGFISIIIRGVILSKLIDHFGEKRLQYMGMVSIALGMLGTVLVTKWWMFLIVITFFSFGSGVVRPITTGRISRAVSRNEQGAILGLTNSLGSLAQIIGPLIGGAMINFFFPGSLGIAAAAVVAIGIAVMVAEDKAAKAEA